MTTFWRAASGRTRTALVVAALALVTHIGGSTGAVGIDDMLVLAPMHLMVMGLALWLVASLVRRRLFGSRRATTRTARRVATVPAPGWLKVVTLAAFAYGLGLMCWLLWRYGEGGPEETAAGVVWIRDGRAIGTLTAEEFQGYQAGAIRMVSAWWFMLALAIAWAGHARRNRTVSTGADD